MNAERNQLRQLSRGTNSRRYNPQTQGSLALGVDGFNWHDAPTPPAIVKRFAAQSTAHKPVSTRDAEFWHRAVTGKSAPTPQPCVALALYTPPIVMADTTTSIQYRCTRRTLADFEAYIAGVTERALVQRKEKAAAFATA